MIITLVAAASENNVIGKNNKLLWNLPNDTKFFKNTTWAMPVLMGRKTFESLNNQPLNGRTNIVITRNPEQLASFEGIKVVTSLQQGIEVAKETDAKEVFVIGGGQIYAASLPIAHKIVLTRVHTTIEGDAYFPVFDTTSWKLVSNLDFNKDDKHEYAYSFQVWERIVNSQ
jgi:dihydrofolate reductase